MSTIPSRSTRETTWASPVSLWGDERTGWLTDRILHMRTGKKYLISQETDLKELDPALAQRETRK